MWFSEVLGGPSSSTFPDMPSLVPHSGGPPQIARINGSSTATVGFDGCIFNAWDAGKANRSAISLDGGNLLVRGCEFQAPGAGKPQLTIGPAARKVIVSDNIVDGPLIIVNHGGAGTRAAIHDNLGDAW